MAKLSLSIIICTKNRPDDLRDCLQSIVGQSSVPFEIIIVDSSDSTDSQKITENYSHLLPIRYFHTKPGLTFQRNYGISRTLGDIILFLDDDVILEKDALREFERGFSINNNIFAVGGLFTNVKPKYSISNLFNKIFLLTRVEGNGKMQKSGFAAYQWCAKCQTIQDTEILCGAAFAYRKEVFAELSFDEGVAGYGFMEDADFSYRVSRKFRMVYNPFARVFHKESGVDRIDQKKWYSMLTYNHYYFFKKNIYPNASWFWFWWSNFGLFLRSLIVSVLNKTIDPVAGAIDGNIKILKEFRWM